MHAQWPWVYHVTHDNLVPLIAAEGLRPMAHPMLEEGELGIFVEPTLEGVSPYISEDTVVLRFRSPGYGESEWGDYVVYGGDSTGSGRPDPPFLGVLPGAIPPELIEILAEEGWQPLTLP